MEQILIFMNNKLVPAGNIGKALESCGANLTVLKEFESEQIDIDSTMKFDGLLVLGGTANAYNDLYPQNQTIVDIIKRFHQSQKPVLGICLGAQLISRTFDKPYHSNNGWEIGFTQITLTVDGKKDPLLKGFGDNQMLYEMHEDSLFLPDGAKLLMTGKKCINQGFRVGDYTYGFQFHPETTPNIIQGWIQNVKTIYPEEAPQMIKQMREGIDQHNPVQKKIAFEIGKQWMKLVKAQKHKKVKC